VEAGSELPAAVLNSPIAGAMAAAFEAAPSAAAVAASSRVASASGDGGVARPVDSTSSKLNSSQGPLTKSETRGS
jgi:hypothetical protein